MKWLRCNVLCGTLVWLAFCAAVAQGQEKKLAKKGIDAETIAAYEKLGAVYGAFTKDENTSTFFMPGHKYADKGLPAFAFAKFPQAKLPEVAVPFGLNLSYVKMTPAELKSLAGLKNLTELNLASTQVTDLGLKELAGLQDLTTLNLGFTQVTDNGLKELASLKNLATLELRGTCDGQRAEKLGRPEKTHHVVVL